MWLNDICFCELQFTSSVALIESPLTWISWRLFLVYFTNKIHSGFQINVIFGSNVRLQLKVIHLIKVTRVLKKIQSFHLCPLLALDRYLHLWLSHQPHGGVMAIWMLGKHLALSTGCGVLRLHFVPKCPFRRTSLHLQSQWIHLMTIKSGPMWFTITVTYSRNINSNCDCRLRIIPLYEHNLGSFVIYSITVYFMLCILSVFWERVCRFHQIVKGVHGTKKLKTL